MATFSVTLPGGEVISRELPEGSSDKDVRSAFERDMAKFGIDVRRQQVQRPEPPQSPYNAMLTAHQPTVSERVGDFISRALAEIGMDERSAYRLGNKFEAALGDLSPVGNIDDLLFGDEFQKQLAILPLPGPAKDAVLKGIRAWHVSPHDFDQFSLGKIGTGEGAQRYGRGLYFAGTPDGPTTSHYKQFFGPESKTYEVSLGVEPEQLMEWDLPAWKQPENVRNLMHEVGMPVDAPTPQVRQTRTGRFTALNQWGESIGTFPTKEAAEAASLNRLETALGGESGGLLYSRLGGNLYYPELDDGRAVSRLRDSGVLGARYQTPVGDPNYVVFDDSLIDILNKY